MIEGLNEEKKKEIYDYVIGRFERYRAKRDNYDERVFDWLRLYNSIPSTERNSLPIEAWEHNMFVPYIFASVETIKPRIKASIFNDPRFLTIDAIDKAYIKFEKNITDWYLFKLDGMKFEKKMGQSYGDALIYPCAWQKVLIKEKDDEVYISTERVDYYDIWVDFAYREELTDAFHRIESNTNKLKALQEKGTYENVDQLIGETPTADVPVYPIDIPEDKALIESLFLSMGDYGLDKTAERAEAKKSNKVEILEWWGSYDINGDGYDEKIIVSIGNRKIGLRIDEYEGRVPFFPIRIGKNTRTIYGRPLAQQLEMLQEELNEVRSKRYDILDRILKLMFKARRLARIDWDTLFSAPDNVILLDDLDDIETFDQKPLPASAYQEEEITKADIEFVTGARDYSGIGTKGTATGINAILSEAATRFRSIVDDIVEDTLDLIEYIFLMIKKYSTKKESIKLFNSQDWVTITPEELKGNYRIKVGISNITTPNKEMRIQLFINLLNVVGRIAGIVDIKEFIRMILHYADIKNVDVIMGETPGGIKRLRMKKAGEKAMKRKKPPVEPGMGGVTGRIAGLPLLEKPLAPAAPQAVTSPLVDIITGMQGGLGGQ